MMRYKSSSFSADSESKSLVIVFRNLRSFIRPPKSPNMVKENVSLYYIIIVSNLLLYDFVWPLVLFTRYPFLYVRRLKATILIHNLKKTAHVRLKLLFSSRKKNCFNRVKSWRRGFRWRTARDAVSKDRKGLFCISYKQTGLLDCADTTDEFLESRIQRRFSL